MRLKTLGIVTLLTFAACKDSDQTTPAPDAGPIANADAGANADDAGLHSDCEGRIDERSGLCVALGLGAQSVCPKSEFISDHLWIANAEAASVVYISPTGTGDGSSPAAPTADPAAALGGGTQAAVLVLGKGEHDFAIPAVDDLTIVGSCSAETSLSLGVRGPLSRSSGQRLRLWGMTLSNGAEGVAGTAINAQSAARIEVFHTVFDGVSQALDANSVDIVNFEQNTLGEVRDVGLGIRGPLSGVIIGDNHFLGPLGGDGVFLGPLGGDGVFRVSGNGFESIAGEAIVVTESAISGSIENNIIGANATVSGDGISLIGNNAGATITVSGNQLNGMAGSAIVIAEGGATYLVSANIVGSAGPLTGTGMLVSDLIEPGSATLSANTITGAVSCGIEVLRNSAAVVLEENQISQTTAGNRGSLVAADAAMAYGIALFDSKNVSASANKIEDNTTAGVLVDLSDWGAHALREDLSGTISLNTDANLYARNGAGVQLNLVVQNVYGELDRQGSDEVQSPPDDDVLPASRSARAFRCGNGEINGSEECDEGANNGGGGCTNNCRYPRGRPFDGGDAFFCATTLTGRVACIGNNADGQSDPSDQAPRVARLRPRHDLPGSILEVTAGSSAACARTSSGKVLCWGTGQLGRGARVLSRQEAAPVKSNGQPVTDARHIDLGKNFGCLVRESGELNCWGSSTLGDGSYPARPLSEAIIVKRGDSVRPNATLVPVLDALAVSVGANFACYTNRGHNVLCWGFNELGQLGQREQVMDIANCGSRERPVGCTNHAVRLSIGDVIDLKAGQDHACVVNSDGVVICWGNNQDGQSRPGLDEDVVAPGAVGGIDNVEQLALGRTHSCARKRGGAVLCWGDNDSGQLGIGSTETRGDEVRAVTKETEQPLAGQRYLAAGDQTNCSLGPNGALFCWGQMFLGDDRNSRARMVTRLSR